VYRTDPGLEAVVLARDLCKSYESPSGTVRALDGVTLSIERGAFVAVVGQSGSGKTTLLNVLAGIDAPTSGEVIVQAKALHCLSDAELTAWRGRAIGLVFQFFQLLPTLTVAENVMLPMEFCGTFPARERAARARALLERVGIAKHAEKFPAYLSGGEQQRAAIARALANDPAIVLADEPTGNLDSRTGEGIRELFAGLAASGTTVVMVTHERDIVRYATREITLADGAVVSDRALRTDAHAAVASAAVAAC
jgi:putative ABC transport system ATP-binding protein